MCTKVISDNFSFKHHSALLVPDKETKTDDKSIDDYGAWTNICI